MDYKITTGRDGKRAFVCIYYQKKRFRLFNGKSIDLSLKASDNIELLRSAFELKLMDGWRPAVKEKPMKDISPRSFIEELNEQLEDINLSSYSYHHKRDCKWVVREWKAFAERNSIHTFQESEISLHQFNAFIKQHKWSSRTQKNVLTTLKCLVKNERLRDIHIRPSKAKLHKPIKDIKQILNDIKQYNDSLYLCCLLTYACLLRPHQEIRLLRWKDVDLERLHIALSGSSNKSGRNRIVPIPKYVEVELRKRYNQEEHYVIRNSDTPYSRDYIKVLWRRYKKQSSLNLENITLYSFRHSGALQVFEKTGSLHKLQNVMGHSDMKVSLTYLRGLELNQLDVKDLPEI